MNQRSPFEYFRLRWPENVVPADSPVWLLYEVDRAEGAVIRTVEIYEDGRAYRNSIAIEERGGQNCPSLIGDSLSDGFAGTDPEMLTQSEFNRLWETGVDRPFWFPQ
jgi:hypothetical protein